MQPAYSQWFGGKQYPVAEQLAREVISLPMHPELNETVQYEIVQAVMRALAAIPSEVT